MSDAPLGPHTFPPTDALVDALSGAVVRAVSEALADVAPPEGDLETARLYGERGVPIVMYGAGPRTILEANAKRADENLLLEDLRRATIVVACAVGDLLG